MPQSTQHNTPLRSRAPGLPQRHPAGRPRLRPHRPRRRPQGARLVRNWSISLLARFRRSKGGRLCLPFRLCSPLSSPNRKRSIVVSTRERGQLEHEETEQKGRNAGRRELSNRRRRRRRESENRKKAHPLSFSPPPTSHSKTFLSLQKKIQAPPGRARPRPLGHARRRRRAGPGGENDVSSVGERTKRDDEKRAKQEASLLRSTGAQPPLLALSTPTSQNSRKKNLPQIKKNSSSSPTSGSTRPRSPRTCPSRRSSADPRARSTSEACSPGR